MCELTHTFPLSLSLFLTSHVKNWIGSEVVKRKRKAGILPLPKFEFSSVSGSHERVLKRLIKKKQNLIIHIKTL